MKQTIAAGPKSDAQRAREYRQRKKAANGAQHAAVAVADMAAMPVVETAAAILTPVTVTPVTPAAVHHDVSNGAALVAALGLTSVSGFFGVTGMTAIFAAAPTPVVVMTAVLEAAKLVTAAWLARHWRDANWLLRLPLLGLVITLMCLTAVGTFGYLTAAHLGHQVAATESVDRDAAPLTQRIALAEAAVRDLDGRVARLDAIVTAATSRGSVRTAMALVSDQIRARADLVTQRAAVAERLADLRVEAAGIEQRRARVTAETAPARYLAALLGVTDSEAVVRMITASIVVVLDPLAVLLTIAATRHAPRRQHDR
jgi:hypothetical protein